MRGRNVILLFLLGALLGGCTPQQWRQMQRDHDKRMKQAQKDHDARMKAIADMFAKFTTKDGKSGKANGKPERKRREWTRSGYQGESPEQAAARRQDRWDSFWGTGEVKDPEPPKIAPREGTGEYEEWTIECGAYDGPERRQVADKMATLLKEVPEIDAKTVSVEHGPDRSRVLYGAYELEYSVSEKGGRPTIELGEEIKRDTTFIRKLAVGEQYPFLQARAIEKPKPVAGPSQWDLRNAQGVYTLHVGVTYATPSLQEYKEAALEWVKVLREEGYEAYYYHEPDEPRVSICVGTFGADVVKQKKQVNPETGQEETVPVYTQAVNDFRAKDQSFQYNLENGHIIYRHVRDPKTKKVERIPNLSFLVRIPTQGESLKQRDDRYKAGQPPRAAVPRRR
ncbi:MAG TPA: hypothetical protein P5081_17300 [Phycisphaerae bacterium]|nr:hypothetical protein [Phycisphaerae bacterium]HRW54629.1 hypothetical protein [Phycisphaerae bacterium]